MEEIEQCISLIKSIKLSVKYLEKECIKVPTDKRMWYRLAIDNLKEYKECVENTLKKKLKTYLWDWNIKLEDLFSNWCMGL